MCAGLAPPMLCRLGDTKVVAEHGSLHQYLRHRHAKDGPIIAFWWTNQQRIVSIASPDVFKATTKLFDRPGTGIVSCLASQCPLELQRNWRWVYVSFPFLSHAGLVSVSSQAHLFA